MSASEWEPPELAASELSYSITSSVVEQFAQGHTVGDVLRELVQNEYDARGSSLSVSFGTAGVEVHGDGRAIDRAGWRRLSVMLGTGHVVGDDRDVPQKVNGIGSKNHGLRALFLIGDQIFIRSGGRQTMLDLHHGTLREPRPDPASRHLPGAHIFVPYRDATKGLLEAYDSAREARDLSLLADQLAQTLVKLAQPRAPRSLRSVRVSSARLDRALMWRQDVKLLRRHRLGGPVLQRTIELRDGANSGDGANSAEPGLATKIVELEYQRSFEIPSSFPGRVFPDYFRAGGGRLRIGISLRLKRRRPDLDDRGAFYYPLGFANSSTGSAIGVNAPFEMNSDRSALAATSSWNEWLMQFAADFTLELLTEEWLDSFGSAAYLALQESQQPAAPEFAANLSAGLQQRACWPSRQRAAGSRRPSMEVANYLMLGASPELDALVPDERRLDSRLTDPRVFALALRADAKDFTVGSAIRLRCAGEDSTELATDLADAAALYYTHFPDPLADIELQERFATAFEAHRRRLTPANRSDLKTSSTTLAASGTLAAPSEPLWVLDDAVAAASPVRASQRLHPRLAQYRTISRECQPFDTTAWARDIATRAAAGTVRAEDREALYRYLLRMPEAISRTTWQTLRRAPIVRDHRNEWAAPADLIHRRTAGTGRIEAALQFPSREVTRNPGLVRRLRVRSKLAGSDLIRYAHIVANDPDRAEDFEETLHQLRRLLTRPTVNTLRSIPFLRSTQGALVAPQAAYVRTPHLLSCLGPEANFAAGRHTTLHLRLRCRTHPEADDIVEFMESLRASGNGPLNPNVLYPALLDALRAEGDPLSLADEPILFAGGQWHEPEQLLVGRKHRAIFRDAVPVIAAGALDRVYEALGASAEPSTEHWLRFFSWQDERSDSGGRRLPTVERKALRAAYAKLGSLPIGVPESARVFLDTSGRLHSKADVRASRYLINDDPRAAEAATNAGLPISFADITDASTRRFYRSSDVLLLTEARRHIGIKIGEQRGSPPWFQESLVLDRLRQPTFISAVRAVAVAAGSRTATSEHQLRRRIGEVTRITFVTELEDRYRIGAFELSVPSDIATDSNRIALRFVRGKFELYGLLARAIAGLAEDTPALQQPLADSVFRLLMSDSVAETKRYLAQRGIVWSAGSAREDDEPGEDEENESRAQVAETLKEKLLQPPPGGPGGQRPHPPTAPNDDQPGIQAPERPALPPLEEVNLQEAPPIDWTPIERQPGGGGGGGAWSPRTPAEQEADRALGLRGEELVYRAELKRVTGLGYPKDRVVWTSKTDPAANHDIRSVADDGGDLWLEVKATTGRHGRFDWPRAEFELALQAGERYMLCRVYEAHTTTPTVRTDLDPVAKLLAGAMRLDISSLAAEVAPLPNQPPG